MYAIKTVVTTPNTDLSGFVVFKNNDKIIFTEQEAALDFINTAITNRGVQSFLVDGFEILTEAIDRKYFHFEIVPA